MMLTSYLTMKNLTPSAFAADLQVPVSTITRLIAGKRAPGIDLMAKIAKATAGQVTPNDFLAEHMERAAS